MKMNRKLTIIMSIAVVAVSLIIGVALGIVLTKEGDPGGSNAGNNDIAQQRIILKNDAVGAPETTWDSEHHSLINLNGRVGGRIIMIELSVEDEEDQYHFLLLPDLEFKSMVNDENDNNFRGAIMVEIMKGDESILPRLFIGQHIEVQGPHVTDIRMGHGWNEIDPALIISEI